LSEVEPAGRGALRVRTAGLHSMRIMGLEVPRAELPRLKEGARPWKGTGALVFPQPWVSRPSGLGSRTLPERGRWSVTGKM